MTALAEADAPDAGRDRPGASAPLEDWLIHLLAVIRFLLHQGARAFRLHTFPTLPSWWADRPDLEQGSALHLAATLRGGFGNVIARMCCQRGIGPGHPEWPLLSRAIVALGGSLKRPLQYAQAGCVSPPEWWENHWVSPAVIAPPAVSGSPLLQQAAAAAESSQPDPQAAPAGPRHARSWHMLAPAFSAWSIASRATGPPGAGVETGSIGGRYSFADFVTI